MEHKGTVTLPYLCNLPFPFYNCGTDSIYIYIYACMYIYIYIYIYRYICTDTYRCNVNTLVGGFGHFLFSHILGMSSSKKNDLRIFQRGRAQPPPSFVVINQLSYHKSAINPIKPMFSYSIQADVIFDILHATR